MNVNNPLYSQWNLESTAKVILSQFPDAAVFVIKPSKMLLNMLSVYENFLYFDDDGIPEFTKDFGALLHLESLYKEAKLRILNTKLSDPLVSDIHGEDSCQATGSGDKCFQEQPVLQEAVPLKLMGFSKGCVVLNQLIYELDTFKDNSSLNLFLANIVEIYWLDGGHLGGLGAYIVEDDKLNDLKKLECKLFIHVTPYQISDPRRKWIGEEEVIFVDKLKELKVDVVECRHFMDDPGSIENHFKVLTLLCD